MRIQIWGFLLLIGLLASSPPIHAEDEDLQLARRLNRAFVGVAERVSPSVVVIRVKTRSLESPHEKDPLWDALPPELREQLKKRQELVEGQGSGLIIRKNGFILTNRHVVEEAQSIKVRLRDGREFTATVHGVDEGSDLAVLRISAEDLPEAALGDSDKIQVGEFAIAIGTPYGLDYSVTFGHINGKGRADIDVGLMDQEFLQTDAAINPGNSGGPLLNIDGEVVGINTMIRGLRTGIGFAIPINLAREISDQLVEHGRFARPWLGVRIQSYQQYAEETGLAEPEPVEGVVVLGIPPNGPAAKSTLSVHDVITAVDGVKVGTVQQLRNEVRRKKIGNSIRLEVRRNGGPLAVEVRAEEQPPVFFSSGPPTVQPPSPLGLLVTELPEDLQKKYKSGGVLVEKVEPDSPAARKKIQVGDVITRVNGRQVENVEEFESAVQEISGHEEVTVHYVSAGRRRHVVLQLSR